MVVPRALVATHAVAVEADATRAYDVLQPVLMTERRSETTHIATALICLIAGEVPRRVGNPPSVCQAGVSRNHSRHECTGVKACAWGKHVASHAGVARCVGQGGRLIMVGQLGRLGQQPVGDLRAGVAAVRHGPRHLGVLARQDGSGIKGATRVLRRNALHFLGHLRVETHREVQYLLLIQAADFRRARLLQRLREVLPHLPTLVVPVEPLLASTLVSGKHFKRVKLGALLTESMRDTVHNHGVDALVLGADVVPQVEAARGVDPAARHGAFNIGSILHTCFVLHARSRGSSFNSCHSQ
mmetsp:Transcript_39744/g.71316  ORF Transcript_39744/g.71316 Transcript_39744/m.71316 type:complete len:299 (+) Transcript_39744:217-1113(+)